MYICMYRATGRFLVGLTVAGDYQKFMGPIARGGGSVGHRCPPKLPPRRILNRLHRNALRKPSTSLEAA